MRLASCRVALVAFTLGFAALAAGSCKRDLAEPKPGTPGVVRGRITIASGPPIQQVVVELRAARDGSVVAKHQSTPVADAKAIEFVLDSVRPASYTIAARAEGRAPAEIAVSIRPGETLDVVLQLDKAETLRGQVVDGAGQPVPQALVYAWTTSRSRLPAHETAADEQGRFAIFDLAAGKLSLLVQTAGLGAMQMDQVSVPSAPLLVKVEGIGQIVRGTVQHKGIAVANARVVLGGATLSNVREGHTDEQGRFVFAGLGEGDYSMRAAHGMLASPVVDIDVNSDSAAERAGDSDQNSAQASDKDSDKPTASDADPNRLRQVNLHMQTGKAVAGRVVDHVGRALANVELIVRAVPPDPCPEIVKTDVVGFFATGPLVAGRYRVVASRPGYTTPTPRTVDVRGSDSQVRITLQPVATIVGRVVGPDRRPVAAAQVSLESGGTGDTQQELDLPSDRVPVLSGTLPLAAEAASLPSRTLPTRAVALQRAATDTSGRFTLDGVGEGVFRVRVEHRAAVTAHSDEHSLSPGMRLDVGDIHLQPGGLVRGTVVNAAGEGRAEVRVIMARSKTDRERSYEVVTTPDGMFELRVPEGSYWIRAEQTDTIPLAPVAVDVEMGDDPDSLTLRLVEAGGELQGILYDPEGKPLAGARVTVRLTKSDPGAQPIGATVTMEDGRFRLQTVADARVIIEAQSPAGARITREALAGENKITMRFPRPGGIEGEVIDPDGRFIVGARVKLVAPDGRAGPEVTMSGAAFEVLGLNPGPWTVVAEAPGFKSAKRHVLVLQGESSKVASAGDISIRLARE